MTRNLIVLLMLVAACTPGGAGNPAAGSDSGSGGTGSEPATLSFEVEPEAAGERLVTFEAGGTLSATAADGTTFQLVIPAEAVAGDTEIRMTPLSNVVGIGDRPVHAVQLEPEGLELFELARLTITPATPIPLEDQMAFVATGDGADAGLAMVDPTSEPIVVLLEHFSLAGAASVTAQQRATFIEKSASNAERRINNAVRSRVGDARFEQLTSGTEDEGDVDTSDLDAEFEREVVDKRREAAGLSCRALQTYLRTVINFERQRQLLVMSETEEAESDGRVAEASAFAHERYDECENEAIAECKEAKDASILMRFWLANEVAADPARARKTCEAAGFALEFTGSDFSLRSPGIGTDSTVDVEGRAEGCPTESGGWSFGGEIALTYSSGFPTSSGDLVDLLRTQAPESFTLEYANAGTTVEFTDALGTPNGEFSLVNGIGETVGPFPLEVVRTELECSEVAP